MSVYLVGCAGMHSNYLFDRLEYALEHKYGVKSTVIRNHGVITMARSLSMNRALNAGATTLVSVDHDNVKNIGQTLLDIQTLVKNAQKHGFVSGAYTVQDIEDRSSDTQPAERVAFRPLPCPGGQIFYFGPGGGIVEVESVPLGMAAIHQRVFTKAEPWTTSAINLEGPFWCEHRVVNKRVLSEDYSFCETVRNSGSGVFVNSTVCAPHLKIQSLVPPGGNRRVFDNGVIDATED